MQPPVKVAAQLPTVIFFALAARGSGVETFAVGMEAHEKGCKLPWVMDSKGRGFGRAAWRKCEFLHLGSAACSGAAKGHVSNEDE